MIHVILAEGDTVNCCQQRNNTENKNKDKRRKNSYPIFLLKLIITITDAFIRTIVNIQQI